MTTIDAQAFPALGALLARQLAVFPQHAGYLSRRFKDAPADHLALSEEIASQVLRIAGDDLDEFLRDYAWLSNVVLEEELHFRRTSHYRLSSFEEAARTIYSDPVYMRRYMNGLLASQVWWRNHTEVIGCYRDVYLASLPPGFRHLEIGPGHGLFLYQTAVDPKCGSLTAWDISQTSLRNTREALDAMGVRRAVNLEARDLFEDPRGEFDSITFSEVLEHLEQPLQALRVLRGLLAPGGRLFVNAPVNSPAPDHIYLFRAPEEILAMVESAGFKVVDSRFFATTGASLDQARRRALAISTAVIAEPTV